MIRKEPSERSGSVGLGGWRLVLAFIVWISAIGLWLLFTIRYETTPGQTVGSASSDWPSGLSIEQRRDKVTIIMLVHPQCPCTRASLIELEALMRDIGSDVECFVLFAEPRDRPPGWESTENWELAGRIADVRLVVDEEGQMAHKLGATVSGHTVVYDRDGRRIFSGGITPARGQTGNNKGRSAILSLVRATGTLARESAGPSTTPTFGCEL